MSVSPEVHRALGSLLLVLGLVAGVAVHPRWRLPERWRAILAGVTLGFLTGQILLGFALMGAGGRPASSPLLTLLHILLPLLALAVGTGAMTMGRRLGPRRYVVALHTVFLAALVSFTIGELG